MHGSRGGVAMENDVTRREPLAGDGAVLDRTILGDCVCYFDLPLGRSGAVSRR
jgi:hypothetical protein